MRLKAKFAKLVLLLSMCVIGIFLTIDTVKADGNRPAKPTTSEVTSTSITVQAIDGYVYSLDMETWQSSNVFSDLNENTWYSVYQKCSGEDSLSSLPLLVKTQKEDSDTVNIQGNAQKFEQLTIVPDGYKGIYTISDFIAIEDQQDSSGKITGKYILMSDLDFSDVYISTMPILHGFYGIFNGNGHTISGMMIYSDTSSTSYDSDAAMFTANYGTICNLIISDYIVSAKASTSNNATAAGICIKNEGLIQNCAVVDITILASGKNALSGGIAFSNETSGIIENCSISYGSGSSIAATASNGVTSIGGICTTNYGTIQKCSASQKVTGISNSYAITGGIVATNGKNGLIENCYSTGSNYCSITAQSGGTTGWGGIVPINEGKILTSYSSAVSVVYKNKKSSVYYMDLMTNKGTCTNVFYVKSSYATYLGPNNYITEQNASIESYYTGFDFENVWIISNGTAKLRAFDYSTCIAKKSHGTSISDCKNGTCCSVCGKVSSNAVGNHLFDNGNILRQASCNVTGVKEYTCSICGLTYKEELEKIPHTYVSSVTKKATCAATGTKKFTCSVCGDNYTESIPKTSIHTFDDCDDQECNICHITRLSGHEYGNTWKTNGTQHWYECSKCQKKVFVANHSLNEEEGCVVCGYNLVMSGDLTADKKVTLDDAIYLLYYTFFPAMYPVNQKCDFNSDNVVDVNDAIYILYNTFFPAMYPLKESTGLIEKTGTIEVEIEKLPNEDTYFDGDTLDMSGTVLRVLTGEGQVLFKNSGFSTNVETLTKVGTEIITVKYDNATTSFGVTVKKVELSQISVETQPNKIDYLVGENFDSSGLVLRLTYNNGKIETVTEGFSSNLSKITVAGTQVVEISYGGLTTSVNISATAVLTSISITQKPSKLEFHQDEALDVNGMEVTAYYNDNTTREVLQDCSFSITKFVEAGKSLVTVTYEEKETTYEVTVSAHEYQVAYDNTSHWEECVICKSVKDSKVNHNYITYYDDDYHWNKCECGYQEGEKESHSLTIYYDDEEHWIGCESCSYEKTHSAHTLVYNSNSTKHWQYCDDEYCAYCTKGETHSFTDHKCTICGRHDITLSEGSIITLGSYEQDALSVNGTEPIEWVVIKVDKEKQQALVASRYALDYQQYNSNGDTDNYWATSTLREWLNNTFKNTAFSEAEKKLIVNATLDNSSTVYTNSDNKSWTLPSEDSTKDDVFCLSHKEVMEFADQELLQTCTMTEYTKSKIHPADLEQSLVPAYVLRSRGADLSSTQEFHSVCNIYYSYNNQGELTNVSSSVFYNYPSSYYPIRPAMWIDVSSEEIYSQHRMEFQTNNLSHWEVCTCCGEETTPENHTFVYKSDLDYHWKECSVCGYIVTGSKQEHTYSSGKCLFCNKTQISISENENLYFGSYEQDNNTENGKEPIEWEVCTIDTENQKALLVCANVIDVQPFSTTEDATWEDSFLRAWLNDEFLNTAFSSTEQEQILTTRVVNGWYASDYYDYDLKQYVWSGNDTIDKVFCLSQEEMQSTYLHKISLDVDCTANCKWPQGNSYNSWNLTGDTSLIYTWFYWSRSTGWQGTIQSDSSYRRLFYSNTYAIIWKRDRVSGRCVNKLKTDYCGVRPAIWIDLSK